MEVVHRGLVAGGEIDGRERCSRFRLIVVALTSKSLASSSLPVLLLSLSYAMGEGFRAGRVCAWSGLGWRQEQSVRYSPVRLLCRHDAGFPLTRCGSLGLILRDIGDGGKVGCTQGRALGGALNSTPNSVWRASSIGRSIVHPGIFHN